MSRFRLTPDPRHLPPWLIFDVRQKKMRAPIEVVQVFEKASRTVRTFHLSSYADANRPFEWWTTADGVRHVLISPDAYYDEALRRRREDGNMIHPTTKTERIYYLGTVSRQIDLAPNSYSVLACCPVKTEFIEIV